MPTPNEKKQQNDKNDPKPLTEAEKLAAFMSMLGTVRYSHEAGTITLYKDKNDPTKKNGRAGHVIFGAGVWNIPCSVYMDVETIKDGTAERVRRLYRISWPKGVKPSFPDAVTEKRFKKLHLDAWGAARTAKQTSTDASDDDSGLVEYDEVPTEQTQPNA